MGVSNSPGGAAELSVAGPAGLLYALESSTDLANWMKIGVSSNATANISFTDKHSTNYDSRFYRLSIHPHCLRLEKRTDYRVLWPYKVDFLVTCFLNGIAAFGQAGYPQSLTIQSLKAQACWLPLSPCQEL
jgi:hypothetical protein